MINAKIHRVPIFKAAAEWLKSSVVGYETVQSFKLLFSFFFFFFFFRDHFRKLKKYLARRVVLEN